MGATEHVASASRTASGIDDIVDDIVPRILEGYRFSVCETARAAAAALDVRRSVYVETSGYHIPVPDPYDARSWFLLAEDTETGQPVGSMRLTPRFAGPLEAEEYFTLPAALRSRKVIELNRFAILPAYRKGKTFLPVVSLGLFKVVMEFLRRLDADYMVVASKPERIWTYEWLTFHRTGLVAQYAKLDYTEHELLASEFRRATENLQGHPFEAFFVTAAYREVVIPKRLPALGLGVDLAAAPFSLRRSA
jgi:N-acyl-L-homoserine lactone synthetase